MNPEEPLAVEKLKQFDYWKGSLSPLQKQLVQETWQLYFTSQKWPTLRSFYRLHEKPVVVRELTPLAGFLKEDSGQYPESRLELLLPGLFLTEDAARYHEILVGYFGFQYRIFKTEPETRQITSAEIEKALNLSKSESKLLAHILILGNAGCGRQQDLNEWTIQSMKETEDFSPSTNFGVYAKQWVAERFWPEALVFEHDRRNLRLNSSITVVGNSMFSDTPIHEIPEKTPPVDGNPFHRRYQVFVSSTYTDLVEERKHAMHALLETKCIPSGMEMFPAAGTDQMNLIKGVIDDCDYYVIIVAGKYGSCGPRGASYTEMEFDYAVSSKKPILAFFHSDIKKLTGEKLEENDTSRTKLSAFTQKVKNQRLCKPWISAEGLASAIKTAIIHAIETNPKPGWVRADSVPTWNMVKELEQRIAELEGRPEPVKKALFPTGIDQLAFTAKITWDESDGTTRYGKSYSFEKQFAMNWDDLFLLLAPSPGEVTSRMGLFRSFVHSLAKSIESEILTQAKNRIIRMGGTVDGELFDKVLQTFLAQKLLKQVAPPRRVRTRIPYWQISPKGIQKLAELRAIRT
jgi:hypothetical protein